jgi:hypothetical protein
MNRRTFISAGRRIALAALLSLAGLAPAAPARADERALPPPADTVLLSVRGRIAVRNAGDSADFDRAMLERVGLRKVVMCTPWTEGDVAFEGVAVRDLLAAVGADGTTLVATALNDYSTEIPITDFDNPDILLALRMNGETMRVRDKGPIWLVYPPEPGEEKQSLAVRARMVWQLRTIEIR